MTVNIGSEGAVSVEGPKGKLSWNLPKTVSARVEGSTVNVERNDESRQGKALHGLSRALIANMVAGVTVGFKKELEIQGVGFKATVQGQKLNLSLGKSHPILFQIPAEVKITVADSTKITIEGIDKHLVGQTAADIRSFYPPNLTRERASAMSESRFAARRGQNCPVSHVRIHQQTSGPS